MTDQAPIQNHTLTECDLATLERMAHHLAAQLQEGDILLLNGTLGAGKTQFSKFLIQNLTAPAQEVPSPTFTLVQTYKASNFDIWHFDLYRLESDMELEEIGWFEQIESRVSLVEWPDRLGAYLPESYLSLDLQFSQTSETRDIHLSSFGPAWKDRPLTHLTEQDLAS